MPPICIYAANRKAAFTLSIFKYETNKKNVGFFLTIYTPFTDIYITLQPVIFKCNKTVIPDLRQMFELQSNTGGVPICHLQAQHSRRALGLLVVFRS